MSIIEETKGWNQCDFRGLDQRSREIEKQRNREIEKQRNREKRGESNEIRYDGEEESYVPIRE